MAGWSTNIDWTSPDTVRLAPISEVFPHIIRAYNERRKAAGLTGSIPEPTILDDIYPSTIVEGVEDPGLGTINVALDILEFNAFWDAQSTTARYVKLVAGEPTWGAVPEEGNPAQVMEGAVKWTRQALEADIGISYPSIASGLGLIRPHPLTAEWCWWWYQALNRFTTTSNYTAIYYTFGGSYNYELCPASQGRYTLWDTRFQEWLIANVDYWPTMVRTLRYSLYGNNTPASYYTDTCVWLDHGLKLTMSTSDIWDYLTAVDYPSNLSGFNFIGSLNTSLPIGTVTSIVVDYDTLPPDIELYEKGYLTISNPSDGYESDQVKYDGISVSGTTVTFTIPQLDYGEWVWDEDLQQEVWVSNWQYQEIALAAHAVDDIVVTSYMQTVVLNQGQAVAVAGHGNYVNADNDDQFRASRLLLNTHARYLVPDRGTGLTCKVDYYMYCHPGRIKAASDISGQYLPDGPIVSEWDDFLPLGVNEEVTTVGWNKVRTDTGKVETDSVEWEVFSEADFNKIVNEAYNQMTLVDPTQYAYERCGGVSSSYDLVYYDDFYDENPNANRYEYYRPHQFLTTWDFAYLDPV